MKKILLSLTLLAGVTAIAQTTLVPDPLFEQALVDMEIDTDGLVNGQIATADAEAVTTLDISYLFGWSGNPEDYIQDVTGLEAFVNLENLTIRGTMIDNLDVSALVKLKDLNCADNMLESIDVSNNPLLEIIMVNGGGDVLPLNSISEIDLSNNPLIKQIIAIGIGKIDLRNGNNNPDMLINVSAGGWGLPPEVIVGNTCIEVDDAPTAQNGGAPYSEWTIQHINRSYNYAAECIMGIDDIAAKISIYPNPASGILYVNAPEGASLQIIDFSGRVVSQYHNVNQSVSLSGIATGTYLVKLVSGQQVETQKIIIKS
ncbi:hypothetical protein AM493_15380 [Flavobacterium akiainvivens]|uniref:Secretion system C-terminal sorting domain-containing protein n=1 Tax=Flavobacterium akiainvivens TaxID=1202724 RepID=A0A0M8MEL5_9FLAO|nr:T9SS type A sorting domain-containing protein [Flavobacterium akiainvivens]KOS07264.1 hypothetical protein AM493_15380 [Flavobacterium akiainvivens]SFQ45880.1 Por secretion system C-terminal sorting domain-containing protein [Flavobacterium akiainvivens]